MDTSTQAHERDSAAARKLDELRAELESWRERATAAESERTGLGDRATTLAEQVADLQTQIEVTSAQAEERNSAATEAKSPKGEDWALAWTIEELESERVEVEKGWFTNVERQVFKLDPFSGRGVETGATRVIRSLILPQRPFQVLAEKDPAGFRDMRKFVVGKEGRVLVYG